MNELDSIAVVARTLVIEYIVNGWVLVMSKLECCEWIAGWMLDADIRGVDAEELVKRRRGKEESEEGRERPSDTRPLGPSS